MPELPEVEVVKNNLRSMILGKEILSVSVLLPRIIRNVPVEEFEATLKGNIITEVSRRGKFLKFVIGPFVLVSHLRMEGKYQVVDSNQEREKHTHVIFKLSDGCELRYLDVRQFGTMDIFKNGQENLGSPLNKLGPEPFSDEFSEEWFRGFLVNRKSKIKSLLLNQEAVVGLGNIYVDEALFKSGIHPERVCSTLKDSEIKVLRHHIIDTLQEAIRYGGSSVRSYLNGEGKSGTYQLKIQIYGKKNEPCLKCSSPIERIVVSGRGTHICNQCQRLEV